MANKKLEQAMQNNAYTDIVRQAVAQPKMQEEVKPKAKEPQTPGKNKVGRPKKENAVKATSHRLSVYINPELYKFWTEYNEKTNGNMANLINTLLYNEMERIKGE